MKLSFSAADEAFRAEVVDWLASNLCDEFEIVRYRGGPGDEHSHVEVNGFTNKDAAWYYPEVSELAKGIKGYVAFWNGVEVSE